jgi:alpha-1,3/alpha-1,6-mannosyltransferase
MLLSIRKSALKSLYRKPFDLLEEKTTLMADKILVNSNFTKSIVQKCFEKGIASKQLDILYPAVNESFLTSSVRVSKDSRR